jgi:hypothetical protein
MKAKESLYQIATRLKELLIEVSPVIEEYTRQVCPQCQDVCCKQKHAVPEERDILYMRVIGLSMPSIDDRDPEETCQFLGEKGCTKPRWQRPLRCTWYFCEALLRAMDEGDQKKSRRLIDMINEIVHLSARLLEVKTDSPDL